MKTNGRPVLLISVAASLLLFRFILMPALEAQNQLINENETLTLKLDRALARIKRGPELDRILGELEPLVTDAKALALLPRDFSPVDQQKLIESTLQENGLRLGSFEWTPEYKRSTSIEQRNVILSIEGSFDAFIGSVLAISWQTPLVQIIDFQVRNDSRDAGVYLKGTLTLGLMNERGGENE